MVVTCTGPGCAAAAVGEGPPSVTLDFALARRLHDVARAQLMHVPPTSRKELLPGATSRGSEASVGTSIVPAGSNGGEAAMAVRSRGEGKEGLGVPVVRGEVVGGMVNGAGEAKGGRP